jgi:hypothetical protein
MRTLKQSEKRNPCPVCGYALEYPPDDFNICPSCGVEFGYETAGRSFPELRAEWIATGAYWASHVDPKPKNWNPWGQLIQAGYSYALPYQFEIRGNDPAVVEGMEYKTTEPIPVFT